MSLDPRELTFLHILRGLDRRQILDFLDACVSVNVPDEAVLSYQDEIDPTMVFVLDGVLEEGEDDGTITSPIRRYVRGEHMGELNVLGIRPKRRTTLRSLDQCSLLVMDETGIGRLRALSHPVADRIEVEALRQLGEQLREVDRRIASLAVGTSLETAENAGAISRILRSLGAGMPGGRAPDATEVLERSPHFARLTHGLRKRLADELEAVAFGRGETVLEEGTHEGDAWIVASGQVAVWRRTGQGRFERLGVLGGGTLFGHLSIIDGDARTATCVAETPSWLYRMPRELVEALVDNATPEGRAVRLCLMDALARQLEQAELRYEQVSESWQSSHKPDLFTADDLERQRRGDG